MDDTIRTQLDNIHATDGEVQNRAFSALMEETEQRVNWAYDAWDELVDGLHDKDNHVRAIAAQVLSNLAKSDPDGRMLKDFDSLLAVTRDERFVTARHCLQSLWKIGTAGEAQKNVVVEGLAGRFAECIAEKNCTLIRYDIMVDLRNLYDTVGDEEIRRRALALIDTEEDLKYRKKYEGVWKKR